MKKKRYREAVANPCHEIHSHIRDTPELRDNTLILVCSDNGPDVGAGSAGPFRGTKATLFEGGIRSPLVVWGPGLISKDKAGKHNETSVFAAFDLVPSLLALTRVAEPHGVKFDGQNLADTLIGGSDASRTEPIFWRRPPDRDMAYGAGPLPDLAVREGDWKLLCEYDGREPELYRLSVDPGEATNLAAKNPEVVLRLTKAVLTWHQSMPADNGPALAAAPPGKGEIRKRQK